MRAPCIRVLPDKTRAKRSTHRGSASDEFRRPRRSTFPRMSTTPEAASERQRALLAAARQRRRGRFRPPARTAPRRAARALLPHARVGARRRGRAAGRAPARLAGAAPFRGAQLSARLAVPDRDQRLPERHRAPARPDASHGLRPGERPAVQARASTRRADLDRAVPGRPVSGSPTVSPHRRRATSSARASSWRSWRRSSCSRRASARR